LASLSFRRSEHLGEIVFEAFASLDSSTGVVPSPRALYGEADGSGTGRSRSESVYKAVSEALERWAWEHVRGRAGDFPQLRLDLDPSTTGFAAFPGLWARTARPRAYLEAKERWSLAAWWEGRIGHREIHPLAWPGVRGIELLSPVPGGPAVVLWKEESGFRAYGFAAGTNLRRAIQKAAVELARNQQVLRYAESSRETAANQNERRLLFFAREGGRGIFDKRLQRTEPGAANPPALVVDCQVPGPWAKYTYVWRCLFDPSEARDTGVDDYFLF
jgi:ribosomal protein S12 methylthiotransferase accessory factor YcaO